MGLFDYYHLLTSASGDSISVSDGAVQKGANQMDLQANAKDTWGSSVTTHRFGGPLWMHAMIVGSSAMAAVKLDVKLASKAASKSVSSSGTFHAGVTFPASSAVGTRKSVCVGNGEDLNRYVGALLVNEGGGACNAGKIRIWLTCGPGEVID
jgi:hypothetical protein